MKRVSKGLLLLSLMLFLAGCSAKKASTVEEKLPKSDESFIWWSERSKQFGSYDYMLKNEQEAFTDLKNKFDLEVVPVFNDTRQIIKEDFLIPDVAQEPEEFSLLAKGTEFSFSSLIKFKDTTGQYSSYGRVTAKYQYLKELDKVKLQSNSVEIFNSVATEGFKGKDLEETLNKLGASLKLEDMDDLLKKFKEATADPEKLKKEEVIIYNHTEMAQKTAIFNKKLSVFYNEDSKLSEIYMTITDLRE
ncbi:hypothetical protein A5881_002324 [Enterococcus termitis]|nr:hypothetical protein A5881_001358 [Enterococcus termitis]